MIRWCILCKISKEKKEARYLFCQNPTILLALIMNISLNAQRVLASYRKIDLKKHQKLLFNLQIPMISMIAPFQIL